MNPPSEIDRYLNGELSDSECDQFETNLLANPDPESLELIQADTGLREGFAMVFGGAL